jgi:hypothetical protein
MDQQNDIAFILGDTIVVLIEHQSSTNENMPLRLLIYIARVYELIVDHRAMYKKKLLKIPKPEFIVLYNSADDFPSEKTLRLSDAFMDATTAGPGGILELTVRVVNINKGKNQPTISNSENLSGYVEFIALVRKYLKSGLELAGAITRSVKDCINQDILADFLKKHASAVINMLTAEFDINVAKEVAREEGIEIGIEKAQLNYAKNCLSITCR